MKRIILYLLLICPFIVFSQRKTETILSEKLGPLNFMYFRSVDIENKDTVIAIYIGFQNSEYNYITDIKHVGITNKSDCQLFMKDLLSVYKVLDAGKRVQMDWDRSPLYVLGIYSWPLLRLEDGKPNGGHTYLKKSVLINLIETISQIDFGHESLLPKKSITDLLF